VRLSQRIHDKHSGVSKGYHIEAYGLRGRRFGV
jgi:hypothetical protein